MPNWCINTIYLEHSDPDQLVRAEKALKHGDFMDEFLPTPSDQDWFKWRSRNWGTKWDVEADTIEYKDGVLTARYDSAWSPPIEFYKHLCELGFDVRALYFEPSSQFCGIFVEGRDGHYSLSNLSAKDIKELIPTELETEFGILGYFSLDKEDEDR